MNDKYLRMINNEKPQITLPKVLLIIILVIVLAKLGMTQIFSSKHTTIENNQKIAKLESSLQTLSRQVDMLLDRNEMLMETTEDLIRANKALVDQDKMRLVYIENLKEKLGDNLSVEVPERTLSTSFNPVVNKVSYNNEISTSGEMYDVNKVRAVIQELAPALVGIEGALVKQYNDTGIRPEILFGIVGIESGKGMSALAQNKNNLTGFRAYPHDGMSAYEYAMIFETKSDCVMATAQLLYTRYLTKGYTNLEQIAPVYCNAGPEKERIWFTSVRSFASQFINTYREL